MSKTLYGVRVARHGYLVGKRGPGPLCLGVAGQRLKGMDWACRAIASTDKPTKAQAQVGATEGHAAQHACGGKQVVGRWWVVGRRVVVVVVEASGW